MLSVGNTAADATVLPLFVTRLLHPEARGRAVQQAEQREVVVLGRVRRQLDDRRVCLKTLPPRSSTKWLCVATNAKAIESGVAKLAQAST